MEGLKKDTRKIKYFLMKMLETVHATTCRTFSISDCHDSGKRPFQAGMHNSWH
jgi:hypothetical protein